MIELPEYTDGCLQLYRIKNDTTKDYPEEYLEIVRLYLRGE